MKRAGLATALIVSAGVFTALPGADAATVDSTRPFKAADLKVEINATDGDAGLQVFLDDEAWKEIRIVNPDGTVIAGVQARGDLKDYGLTELFSESSEPPFAEFPLAEFKKLFPEGTYVFSGVLVDGTTLRSEVPLTHDFPDGPTIIEPVEGAEVAPADVVVRWEPSPQTPPDVDIVGYQVIVVREDDTRSMEADLTASTRTFHVPVEFLEPGTEYTVEVLAIETSGNQTLTEVGFSVS